MVARMRLVLMVVCALAAVPALAQQDAAKKLQAPPAGMSSSHGSSSSSYASSRPRQDCAKDSSKACAMSDASQGSTPTPNDMAINEKGMPDPKDKPASKPKQKQ